MEEEGEIRTRILAVKVSVNRVRISKWGSDMVAVVEVEEVAGDQETKAVEETADGSPLGIIFTIKAKYQTSRFIIACCASVIGNLVFEEILDSTRLIRLLLVDIRT